MENSQSLQIVEDLHQSKEYGRYMERIGWKIYRVGSADIFVRKLGSWAIAKMQRPNLVPKQEELLKFLRTEKVFMCKIEPLTDLKYEGFRHDKSSLLGSRTLRVDLRPSEEGIMAGFKKNCRYIFRKFQIPNSKIQINDHEGFYIIWQASATRKKLWIPSRKDYLALIECFGENCFSVTIDDQAGAFILIHKETAFYYYAGATKVGTEMDLPYLVVWEAMKEAKKRKCKVWDFEGIYDPRWPNRRWLGFTHFKKSFGGEETLFPGCFTKWRLPL